jgi:hypothetical protein
MCRSVAPVQDQCICKKADGYARGDKDDPDKELIIDHSSGSA